MEHFSTILLSISSGLLGASISAYFSYRIRLSLDEKAKRDAEQKLAYVYIVKLSLFLAINTWLTSYLKNLTDQLDDPIPEGEFELGHAISVLFEDALANSETDGAGKFKAIEQLIDQFVENLTKTYMSNEQQAKLPKEAIIFYQRYEQQLKQVVGTIQMLKIYLSNSEMKKELTANAINDGIETVKSFFDAAGLLRAAMVEYGNISKAEAISILEQQYNFFSSRISQRFDQGEKIERAKEHLKKSGGLNNN